MQTLIIYKSVTGATEQYAKWIAEDTGADIASVDDNPSGKMSAYDSVVFMSAVNGFAMLGKAWLETNWGLFAGKRVMIAEVGLINPESEDGKKSFAVLPDSIREAVQHVKLPGRPQAAGGARFQNAAFNLVGKMRGWTWAGAVFGRENIGPVVDWIKSGN